MSEILTNLLNDFLALADGTAEAVGIWREDPVDLLTFFTGKNFLRETPYPGKQTELLEIVNDVLWWKLTDDPTKCEDSLREITEVIAMFGKGCKHGDTKIIDAVTGKCHTFKELYESGEEITLTSLDEVSQKLITTKASEVVRVGTGEVYEVTTMSGHKTKVYPEHVFLSRKYTGSSNGLYRGLEWKKVSDLTKGDYIALSRETICDGGTSIDKNELRLVGYLLGDGNISDAWRCTFFASIKEVEEDYCSILRYFGVEPKYPSYSNEGRPDRNCVAIDSSLTPWQSRKLNGNPITNILRKYGMQGLNAYNKHVPREFLDLNKECTIEFLSAIFATDGWVCLLNGRTPQAGYCSVSRELVEGILLMLNKLGIVARIDTKKTNSKCGIAYQLTINSEVDFRKFCTLIKVKGKEEKQNYVLDNMKVSGKRKDTAIYFDKIKDIKYIGEDYYYDLTVEEYANYVSDGFIDHNSGKDFLVSGIIAYVCYLLCCMNDPQGHFNFGTDENIDIINVAINANQANGVFFKKLKARLSNCKWFKKSTVFPTDYNQYQFTKSQIRFYKNITAHSAHSEADSFEGFNPLVVVFDEIGGYDIEKAESSYSTLRSSAASRYNDKMLLIFISFPRSMDDMIMRKYKEATAGDDPQVYAMIGKSWEVNPRIKREHLEKDYITDPESAQIKYECVPPAYRDGFFKFPEKIAECVHVGKASQCPGLMVEEKIATRTLNNGVEKHFIGLEVHNLVLDPSFTYYIGGDGGVITDSYIISLFHSEPALTQVVENGETVDKWFNKPIEDLTLEWRPSKKDRLPVDLLNVADILEMICKQVFVKKALFDKFNSAEVVQRLMLYGVEAEDKNWSNPYQILLYTNMKTLIYTGQIELLDYVTPYEDASIGILNPNEELKAIKILNGNKITHDPNKAKDFSDARVAGVYICSTDEPDSPKNFSMPIISGVKRK